MHGASADSEMFDDGDREVREIDILGLGSSVVLGGACDTIQ